MRDRIKTWFVAHNISSHTVAAGAIFAGSLYVSNDQVKAMVDAFLSNHKSFSAVFTVLMAAYLKYSHGHNPNN